MPARCKGVTLGMYSAFACPLARACGSALILDCVFGIIRAIWDDRTPSTPKQVHGRIFRIQLPSRASRALRWQAVAPLIAAALLSLLGGCASGSPASPYGTDVHAYLKTLVYCENHYPALKDTPECRAAFRKNEEMFPGWYP